MSSLLLEKQGNIFCHSSLNHPYLSTKDEGGDGGEDVGDNDDKEICDISGFWSKCKYRAKISRGKEEEDEGVEEIHTTHTSVSTSRNCTGW